MVGRTLWRPSSRTSDSRRQYLYHQSDVYYNDPYVLILKKDTVLQLLINVRIWAFCEANTVHICTVYHLQLCLVRRTEALCLFSASFTIRDEMTLTRKIGYLRYFYSAAYFFSAILVIVSAIVPHALSKGIILRRIFTTASYCMVLRMTLTRQLPGSIQMWYDTLALVKKIEVRLEGGWDSRACVNL